MSEAVNTLTKKLGITKGKKPKAEHHIQGRNFPFHTRNPERVKFTEDFNEIVGIIARLSFGEQPILEEIKKEHLENIVDRLDIGDEITESDLEGLFDVSFDTLNNPMLFKYHSVLLENKSQKDESRGKELLALFITKLLQLDQNEEWKSVISNYEATDLYEKIFIESLPELSKDKGNTVTFHFFDQEELVGKFNKDLHQLMKNQKFFIDNVGGLISYYFFYYVLQQSFLLVKQERKIHELWFTYDKEKVTTGRDGVQKGYKVFNEESHELLVNNDLLDYLNILSEKTEYQTFSEIVNDTENAPIIGMNLMNFNKQFADSLDETYEASVDLKKQIKQLKSYLKKNISAETASRYRKSFDEFSGLSFIKSRGRLGYVLNATQEFILLFTAVVIGDKEKVLLKVLFREFEERGIFFDKQSKKELITFFEDINILEKLSDSGDAQYVKSIL